MSDTFDQAYGDDRYGAVSETLPCRRDPPWTSAAVKAPTQSGWRPGGGMSQPQTALIRALATAVAAGGTPVGAARLHSLGSPAGTVRSGQRPVHAPTVRAADGTFPRPCDGGGSRGHPADRGARRLRHAAPGAYSPGRHVLHRSGGGGEPRPGTVAGGGGGIPAASREGRGRCCGQSHRCGGARPPSVAGVPAMRGGRRDQLPGRTTVGRPSPGRPAAGRRPGAAGF